MKRLKLQMQLSVDGFVSSAKGKSSDWMVWDFGENWAWDKDLQEYHTSLTASIDCVLLSRKMAEEGFIDHWADMAVNTTNPQSAFARNINNARKIVVTQKLERSIWNNTELAKGDLVTEVNKLKAQGGKDIIVYGGASFVSALIKERLIDEYHLIINPTILGSGVPIFNGRQDLTLISARSYGKGMVVLVYAAIL
ncbi:dihydrofolate reductase family protein [Chitinophaga niabensis]|uniref:Dihydrofolate reductase n=1 Tax=Chitinophaga niabensis TaxID=536979 RepID=A0A1N6JU92_9BACT|nr:dihydrofolate reductase family protein [Chitinophaga niabensis]SIO47791.1 Dihydrofolate reductase [Chitinophaga niabensis]